MITIPIINKPKGRKNMSDCIFCLLANGNIPTATLFENDDFRVILDAGPATDGHCLILPKAHYANLLEMPDDLIAKAHVLAKQIGAKLMEVTGCDGFNVVQNNNECAGQTVFHYHVHIIPRYEGGEAIVGWNPGTLSDDVKEKLVNGFNA
ncbi:MAG: HIT family protein [Lachnospiraceae bacterium]|nr:HIT family protein [Candidatus Equihabitans merdae]